MMKLKILAIIFDLTVDLLLKYGGFLALMKHDWHLVALCWGASGVYSCSMALGLVLKKLPSKTLTV